MGYTEDILNDIRSQTDAQPEPLAQARDRLDLVQTAASTFPGALRIYRSGSLPQNTFVHPVGDGDGGLVLDRRAYPQLGPDGGGDTLDHPGDLGGCWFWEGSTAWLRRESTRLS